jgi:hypothetical protein
VRYQRNFGNAKAAEQLGRRELAVTLKRARAMVETPPMEHE